MKSNNKTGCCHSFHTRNCCLVTSFIGAIFIIVGIVFVAFGPNLIFGVILKTMALHNGTDQYSSWLMPPVESHLQVYAFNVINPEEVAKGEKPKLVEVGPFTYKVVTIKDSRDSLVFNDDGETLTYRPRKFYYLDREHSIGDPDTTFITVPNIPYWTALHNNNRDGLMWGITNGVIHTNGRATPFVTVSFSGLLWGYEDTLPCIKMLKPEKCLENPFEGFDHLINEDDLMDEDDYYDYDFRRKRSVEEDEDTCYACTEKWPDNYEKMWRPKAEWVNCSCQWGLFRDRNVTLRNPVTMYHGIGHLAKKGRLKEFDGKDSMGWWKEGSHCDKIGGQDGGTFPPNVYTEDSVMEIFMSLMCRKIKLYNIGTVDHAGIRTLRFAPSKNVFGSHLDTLSLGNRDNECFCMADEGFTCFESGVYDMGPCNIAEGRPYGTPIALSAPHFYQADPIFREQVEGMMPDKEKHQFYVDVVPEFGVPLAIRPRFQLNLVMRADQRIQKIQNFPERVVVPFLWAQDGYSEPSDEMAHAIRKGLDAPGALAKLGGMAFLATGAVMMLSSLSWFVWSRCTKYSRLETATDL